MGVVFYKDLLEKIGLEIQVIRHGKFKSVISYMYNGMSDENREQLEKMLNSMSNVINEECLKRNISLKRVLMRLLII